MADPDLALTERGGGWCLFLLELIDFVPSVIFSFLTQSKGGGGSAPQAPTLIGH